MTIISAEHDKDERDGLAIGNPMNWNGIRGYGGQIKYLYMNSISGEALD